MPYFASEYWDRIDEILRKKKLSYKELAAAIDVSYDVVRQWKSKNRYPKGNLPQQIAEYLGVSNGYLVSGIEGDLEEPKSEEYNYLMKAVKKHPELCKKLVELLKEVENNK